MVAAVSAGNIVALSASAFTDSWLSVLSFAAAVYLLEWLQNGRTGNLVIAAAAAGLLPWFKQEGMILVLVLIVSLIAVFMLCRTLEAWTISRLLVVCRLIGLTALIFGGSWRLRSAREAVLVSQFMPLTTDNLLAHLARLPGIFAFILRELLRLRTGLVRLVVVGLLWWRRANWSHIIRRPSIFLLLVTLFYLGLMTIPYPFSDCVPYQQHLLSSIFRIDVHVLLLLLPLVRYST